MINQIEDKKQIPTMVLQPSEYRRDLLPHQLASIYEMEKLESPETFEYTRTNSRNEDTIFNVRTFMGINADMTGYGKTLSMIGLIVRDTIEWDCKTLFTTKLIKTNFDKKLLLTRDLKYKKLNATLVLMNKTIIKQWEKELSYTPLRVITINKKNRTHKIFRRPKTRIQKSTATIQKKR